ncbi:MAG: hypothetical protein ACOYT7_00490 [Patescibacteria group bacterium]
MALQLTKYFARAVLEKEEVASLFYHDIFDYPLTEGELIRWRGGKKLVVASSHLKVRYRRGFYYLGAKAGVIFKRLLRQRISAQKLKIARKAGKILSFIPSIKMVAVTGALAMRSAQEGADVDLLLVTQKGMLWTSRLLTLLVLSVIGFPLRKFGAKNQKDKLCLNLWLDESKLAWPKKDRNAYTAHEIAQIVPLVNKDKTYEKFMTQNAWLKDYWPNAVGRLKVPKEKKRGKGGLLSRFFERMAFQIQYLYMRKKITREKISAKYALFHPHNWGKVVMERLTS